jgi:hypothetical protein
MARRAPMPQRIPDYDSVACLEALLLGNEGSMSGGGGLLTVVSESRRAEVRSAAARVRDDPVDQYILYLYLYFDLRPLCRCAGAFCVGRGAPAGEVPLCARRGAGGKHEVWLVECAALLASPPPPPRALKAVMAAAATAARRAAPAGGPASDTGEELSIPAISIPAAAAGAGGFDAPPPASSAPAAGARDAGARLGPIGSPTGEAWSSSSRRLGNAGASGPLSPIAPRPRTTDPAAGSRGAGSPEEGASGKDAAATDAAWVPWRADNAKSRVNVRKRAGGGTAGSMSPTHDA